MSIFSYVNNLFKEKPEYSGLLLDDASDLENLPRHELFAGAPSLSLESRDWTAHCPPFRSQGSSYWCTAFAGTAIGHMFEHAQNGVSPIFSAVELFYRTGGGSWGNYLLNVAKGMQESLVLESDVPTPRPTSWSAGDQSLYHNASFAKPEYLEKGKKFRLAGVANVRPDLSSMRAALQISPLYIAVGIGRGYFDRVAPRQTSYSVYHAVPVVKIESDGRIKIFDSLTQTQTFDGFHHLAPNYEVTLALSFIDIPENWFNLQNAQMNRHGALHQYGLRRVLVLEQMRADELARELKKHPTLTGFVGRDWTICVNALAYGGYSVQDLFNHYTQIRRSGRGIFNLERPRNAQ